VFSVKTACILLGHLLLVTAFVAAGRADPNPSTEQVQINGLDMHFVPVKGTNVLFSVYQTRVKDFEVFIQETGYVHMRETADAASRMWSLNKDGQKQRGNTWKDPGFAQTADHPVVGVSWYDAKAFCEWLTLRERGSGRLAKDREYRLPTDAEWSVAVGLEEDSKKSPEEKNGKKADQFPWGTQWPPPKGAGNFAGEEAKDDLWPSNFKTITGYKDGFARTAPVGQFQPNRYGLFDLGSNVLEWCEDPYEGPGYRHRVLRGASWGSNDRDTLLSSHRNNPLPGYRDVDLGFRCVIGPSSSNK